MDSAEARALVVTAQTILDDPEKENEDYEVVTRMLRELITAMSVAVTDTPARNAVHKIILERQGPIADQARVWCLPLLSHRACRCRCIW
jgi:hypothetical protein